MPLLFVLISLSLRQECKTFTTFYFWIIQVQIELFESESTLGAAFVVLISLVASALFSIFEY